MRSVPNSRAMKNSMGRSQKNNLAVGPANPVLTPPGLAGDPCQIIFGHNVEAGRVLMQFSRSAERLIFTPDEADDVATKLHHYAEAARGHKPA